ASSRAAVVFEARETGGESPQPLRHICRYRLGDLDDPEQVSEDACSLQRLIGGDPQSRCRALREIFTLLGTISEDHHGLVELLRLIGSSLDRFREDDRGSGTGQERRTGCERGTTKACKGECLRCDTTSGL